MQLNQRILISGAGIAGLTLAYWLHKFGFQPTLIEKRPNFDDRGYMIDFYGSGYDVAEKMGILEAMRAQQYPITKLELVDRHGRTRASLSVDQFDKVLKHRYCNIMRGDLAAVLLDSLQGAVPIRYGVCIDQIEMEEDAAQVRLSDGTHESYDLVVGADGIHSHTRSLLWGDERQFEHYLGFDVACAVIDQVVDRATSLYSYIEPHKQASVYPISDDKQAIFLAFATEGAAPPTRQQQHDLIDKTFASMGWYVPEILAAMKQAPYLFFDKVSQIKLEHWHQDRVVLVGDACQCLTLLAGQGASMAMAGAYILAEELQRAGGDYRAAFAAYQARLKPEIDQRQRDAQKLAKSFIPDNYLQINLLNLFLKFSFLPGFQSILIRQTGAASIFKQGQGMP